MTDKEILSKLRESHVPEPSPLFWQHLSQRVHDAVAQEPVPSRSWTGAFDFRWAVVATISAVTVIALAVMPSLRRHATDSAPSTGAATAPDTIVQTASGASALAGVPALPALSDDASFAVMGELASDINFDDAAASMVAPGTAEDVFSQLSDEEQRALVQLLQQALKDPRSPSSL